MLKHFLATLAITALFTAPLYAVEPSAAKPTAPGVSVSTNGEQHMRRTPPKTRQEAIARTKENLAKLEKMTDAEWAAKKKERDQRREARKERRKERAQQKNTAPAVKN